MIAAMRFYLGVGGATWVWELLHRFAVFFNRHLTLSAMILNRRDQSSLGPLPGHGTVVNHMIRTYRCAIMLL